MYIFETLLYLLGIIFLLVFITNIEVKPVYIVSYIIFSFIVLIFHLLFEPYRWYLLLLYISWIVILLIAYFYIKKARIFKRVTTITFIFLVVSFLINLALLIPDMPVYENDVSLGTNTLVITDSTRIEQYDDSKEYRKFKIQYWYETDDVSGLEKAMWLEEGTDVAKGLCEDNNLPSFFLNHLALVESNSYKGASLKVTTEKYPVVIISHGWRGFRNLHTDIAEELASNGYFVISIDHTYGSVATVFSDTELAYNYDDALPGEYGDDEYLVHANQLVNTYASDVLATIDYLETVNSTMFNNLLDLNKIGLLGHSTGGGGDVAAALNDSRIVSLVGLDAWVEPIEETLINETLDIPTLFLRSNQWEEGDNNSNLYNLVNNSSTYSSLYQIDNTTHVDFTMTDMMSTLTNIIGLTGDLDSGYINQILETMIIDFFDSTLKDNEIPNLNIEEYNEVNKINTN